MPKLKSIILILLLLPTFVFSQASTESEYDYLVKKYLRKIEDYKEQEEKETIQKILENPNVLKQIDELMIPIPETNYSMLATEVTQKQYEYVMGSNPSEFKGTNLPVDNITWIDAVKFCNKLSVLKGLEPCYELKMIYFKRITDIHDDGYTSTRYQLISESEYKKDRKRKLSKQKYEDYDFDSNTGTWKGGKKISSMEYWKDFDNSHYICDTVTIYSCDINKNGFRLPSIDEWLYSAKGGENFKYPGSDNYDEIAWVYENSQKKTHAVAQKKSNGYGLFDMMGNVAEWTNDNNARWGALQVFFVGNSYKEGAGKGINYIYDKDKRNRSYIGESVMSKTYSSIFIGFRIAKKK